jgi:hypothetical protein
MSSDQLDLRVPRRYRHALKDFRTFFPKWGHLQKRPQDPACPLSSEKTIEIQATISSLDLEICKVAIISCKNKHGTRSAGSRPRLALCNTTQAYTGYTLDTRATPPHDPSMHCAYFFQKPFRHIKLVTPRDEPQNLLIHILLVA